jgi:hypothetical protein
MRNPPKAMQSLIDLAANHDTTVDEMLAALANTDKTLLEKNAFHVLQAIPDKNMPNNIIKFASVHYVMDPASFAIASIANTAVMGNMSDKDAYSVVSYLLNNGWMRKVPSLLYFACANGKRECVEYLNKQGLYNSPVDWDYWLRAMDESQALQMAKVLIEIVKPSREDLLALRLAAKSITPMTSFLDQYLELNAVQIDNTGRNKH